MIEKLIRSQRSPFFITRLLKVPSLTKLQLLNRANTISAQTPQLVKKDYFIKSYLEAIKDNFIPTDDISLILKYFPDLKVAKVLDEEMNFKITTQFDLDLARRLI